MASTYGWTHREILDLKTKQFQAYLKNCKYIEARHHELRLEASVFTYLKSHERRMILERLRSTLQTETVTMSQVVIDDAWTQLRKRRRKFHGR